jgi:hypothetical protein
MTERDEGRPADAARRGDFFFGVHEASGKVVMFYADKVAVEHNGVLSAYRKRGDELQITLAWPPGRWERFWEASCPDGGAVAIDSVVEQRRDIPESRVTDSIQVDGGTLSAVEFAGTALIDYETVLLWLKEGLIPGARKVSGMWEVPAAVVSLLKAHQAYQNEVKRLARRRRGLN